MVADLPWPLTARSGEEPLDVRPGRSQRQAFLFEDPRPLDASGKAHRTPRAPFSMTEERA